MPWTMAVLDTNAGKQDVTCWRRGKNCCVACEVHGGGLDDQWREFCSYKGDQIMVRTVTGRPTSSRFWQNWMCAHEFLHQLYPIIYQSALQNEKAWNGETFVPKRLNKKQEICIVTLEHCTAESQGMKRPDHCFLAKISVLNRERRTAEWKGNHP